MARVCIETVVRDVGHDGGQVCPPQSLHRLPGHLISTHSLGSLQKHLYVLHLARHHHHHPYQHRHHHSHLTRQGTQDVKDVGGVCRLETERKIIVTHNLFNKVILKDSVS